MQLHSKASRVAALCAAALIPLAGLVAVAPSATGTTPGAAAAAPVRTVNAPAAKKKQQTQIAIGTRLAEGSSTGPQGFFVDMMTYVGYDCVSPNGKTRYTHTALKNKFTETRFLMVALDLVKKKTGKKWSCTISMTKPEWEPAGGKWVNPTWFLGKDGTFKKSPGTGWSVMVKAPQGKVTYVRAMNTYTGKGKKYKPKIGKVPDVYANGTLGGR